MGSYYIFYSWQSDLPNNTNRGFIEQALISAVKAIKNNNSIEVDPVIDRDTAGVPGAPNIAETILRKIERAKIFVCDISIINESTNERKTPNPNVLFELGYAVAKLGHNRIVLVCNTAYGNIESLPFDLRMMRKIPYSIRLGEEDKAGERKVLQRRLEEAISTIITGKDELKYAPIEFITTDEEALFPIIQQIFYAIHIPKSQIERLIKQRTSLYANQAKLLVDYLIDYNYIVQYGSSSVYLLSTEGKSLYHRHTSRPEGS